ncbi:hypothetical protein LA345_40540 (plasmid) [Burkholderia vietnamiensis]|nr:hypothetical protein [Burkholderia vietnamiensis]
MAHFANLTSWEAKSMRQTGQKDEEPFDGFAIALNASVAWAMYRIELIAGHSRGAAADEWAEKALKYAEEHGQRSYPDTPISCQIRSVPELAAVWRIGRAKGQALYKRHPACN